MIRVNKKNKSEDSRDEKYDAIWYKLTAEEIKEVEDRAIELIRDGGAMDYESLSFADIITDLFFRDIRGDYRDIESVPWSEINSFRSGK